MRKLLLLAVAFLLLAAPAWANDTTTVTITIEDEIYFNVDTTALNATYNEFGTEQDIGDIQYDLYCNSTWDVDAYYTDGDDDWDAAWVLDVNGTTISEGGAPGTQIDSGTAQSEDDALWQVDLLINWANAPAPGTSYDCDIIMTAATP